MDCTRCNDTGVIETGNNDLPCDCKAGDKALFTTCGHEGPVTGAKLRGEIATEPMIQHTFYLAKACGLAIPYEFGWWNSSWPCSPDLRRDLDAGRLKAKPATVWLPDLVRDPMPPSCTHQTFMMLLARIHYAITQHGMNSGQAFDTIEHELLKAGNTEWASGASDLIAAEHEAYNRLSKLGLLTSGLTCVSPGDPKKVMEALRNGAKP